MDYRRNKATMDPIIIKGEPVDIIDSYKHLATIINNLLDNRSLLFAYYISFL